MSKSVIVRYPTLLDSLLTILSYTRVYTRVCQYQVCTVYASLVLSLSLISHLRTVAHCHESARSKQVVKCVVCFRYRMSAYDMYQMSTIYASTRYIYHMSAYDIYLYIYHISACDIYRMSAYDIYRVSTCHHTIYIVCQQYNLCIICQQIM